MKPINATFPTSSHVIGSYIEHDKQLAELVPLWLSCHTLEHCATKTFRALPKNIHGVRVTKTAVRDVLVAWECER